MEFKYKNIFWLEDYPDFFPRLIELAGKLKPGVLTPSGLLDRVDLALDLDEALRTTTRSNFDLCITDGDFPNYADQEHREEVIRKISGFRVLGVHFEIENRSGEVAYNFVNFYNQLAFQRLGSPLPKVVVLSSNIGNSCLSFNLGLPFYAKGTITVQEIKDYVAGLNSSITPELKMRQRIPADMPIRAAPELVTWECGSLNDFIGKYLF